MLARMLKLTLVVTLAVATPALAGPRLLEPSDLKFGQVQLADYHGAAPVHAPPHVRPVAPHASGSADLFLLGLGFAAGGLVLGGAGFAVLYACREGTSCYGDVTTVVGWALAAPGVIPLAIGLVMMWLGAGAPARVSAPTQSSTRWAFGLAPIPGGGVVSAAARF